MIRIPHAGHGAGEVRAVVSGGGATVAFRAAPGSGGRPTRRAASAPNTSASPNYGGQAGYAGTENGRDSGFGQNPKALGTWNPKPGFPGSSRCPAASCKSLCHKELWNIGEASPGFQVSGFMGVTLLGLNFVGDGLRDAFDPRAK